MPQGFWHTLEPLSSCPSVTEKKGFPGDSDGKESTCNAGDLGSFPGLGRSPGEGNGYRLQYSGLENYMNRGAWKPTVHGVTKSWTRLGNFQLSHQSYKDQEYPVRIVNSGDKTSNDVGRCSLSFKVEG